MNYMCNTIKLIVMAVHSVRSMLVQLRSIMIPASRCVARKPVDHLNPTYSILQMHQGKVACTDYTV